MADYVIHDMAARAAAAVEANKEFVENLLGRYRARTEAHRRIELPSLAILGMGRAGKDTAAKYICDRCGLTYAGSSSNNLGVFVAHMAGEDYHKAFEERHQHREFWIAAGHAVRGMDLTLLAKLAMADGDFAIGLRGREELYGCYKEGLIDAAIWIDNPRVPNDPTVEFTSADCDLMVPNHGSFMELYKKLDRLIALLGLNKASARRFFEKE